ncbi:tyrosine-type recombinase/integrase [Bifidobacterium crudilactis]|uniref:tyrosine-type recombinase/integrase n=1 Tax=Bifidobacterium crudilactis TaxID=327277 RepID=UPI003C6C390A
MQHMLFTSKRSKSGIISPATFQQQFRKARHHIGRDDIVFHSLRATHATKLTLNGGTLREVMNSLGHNSVTVGGQTLPARCPRSSETRSQSACLRVHPINGRPGTPEDSGTRSRRRNTQNARLRRWITRTSSDNRKHTPLDARH